jgi:uncharacterized protein involved in exopolysaccharide biosynthesis
MSLLDFYRIVIRNFKWLLMIPLALGCLVILLTRNGKREYASSTLLYTGLASGYSITSGEDSRVDYFAVNNAFDNIMTLLTARETLEEVSMRLLASHLSLDQPDSIHISQDSFAQLQEWLHPDEISMVRVSGDAEATYERILAIKYKPEGVPVKKLLNTPGVPYNIAYIRENLNVQRKSSSDMLELIYTTHDPGICQQTLQLLTEVFFHRYKKVKSSETMQVVSYFEEQVARAQQRLRDAEDELRDFGVENRIINYNEQTKFISEAKEDLDKSRQEEEMELAQAQAALSKLETSLAKRTRIIESSDKVLQLRQSLSDLQYQIAQIELLGDSREQLPELRQKAARQKAEIQAEVNRLYQLNFTQEGLYQPTLLSEWMDNYLKVDAIEARIRVIDLRINQFEQVYDEFAPLGSTLNRLEREVSVLEKEFLSLLHGLNQAKLRQQNLELSNNLKVIDGAYFPEKPKASKRAMLVIGASFVSFTLVLTSLVVGHLFDFSLRTPQVAVDKTGLALAGALPARDGKGKVYDLPKIQSVMLRHLSNRLKLHLRQEDKDCTYCAILGAGNDLKTAEVAGILAGHLHALGYDLALLTPQAIPDADYLQKEWSEESEKPIATQLDQLLDDVSKHAHPSLVLIVLPDLIQFDLPVHWLKKLDLSLVVARATNTWTESDAFMLHNYEKAINHKPLMVLDEVKFENLESIMGEVPRKRTLVRRLLKKILMFRFN